tara:strand:+ start:9079 stop:9294 length:216 start_codon:yes stop_codon:yes gene_type:complete
VDKIKEKMKTYFIPLGFVGSAKVGKVGCLVTKDRCREGKNIMILVYSGAGAAGCRKGSMEPIDSPLNVLDR